MAKRKNRKWTAKTKAELVLSVLMGEKSQAEVCREHEISGGQFSNWKQQFLANADMIFTKPDKSQEQAEIAELERMVGRLTMQLEIAKKASSLLTSHSRKNGKWS